MRTFGLVRGPLKMMLAPGSAVAVILSERESSGLGGAPASSDKVYSVRTTSDELAK